MMTRFDTCIAGYYGMKNSGDDALLAATAWGAQTYLHARQLTVTTQADVRVNQKLTFAATLATAQRFRAQHRLQRYAQAIQAQRVIFGGGSVFHNEQDINVKRHMMMIAGNNNHLALGVGLGPFANVAAEKACAKFLNSCSFVGLRDQQSYQMATALAPAANVKLTFDLAPLLLCNADASIAMPQRQHRAGIAVCLCPKERLSGNPQAEQRRIERLAQALTAVHNLSGETIYLVNLNGHPSLGDRQVHLQLQQCLGPQVPVQMVEYNADPQQVLRSLAAFKVVISMRLHGSILAYLAETPVVSLNYHSKCEGWCDQVGMAPELRFNATDVDPAQLTKVMLQGLEHGFTQSQLCRAEAIAAAKQNWSCNYG
ncbi:polysaccharide pyruvyl transferase family protein [Ferrimonas lipolytica]|uniref:Polysaccharide pyruvyl transferase family protein n=1 Tax=Ferrimonas lipolytica TaxID=2724191 RepID=A0A6H1UDE0_9GAMM|nr:polysaccharide pyruvyl transferase family protein [Ferrimonas lipolytica]QIZ76363.1 polysaccharide pyruvyl transferase family protein [Ferrimonas lipolytica]